MLGVGAGLPAMGPGQADSRLWAYRRQAGSHRGKC